MSLRLLRTVSVVLLACGMLLAAGTMAACERAAPVVLSTPTSAPPTDPPAAAAPARIIALSPAIAVALRDIGLGHLIAGRHGFDAWTDQSVPVCGDQSGIDYESLLAVRPTHVLVQWGQRDLPARLTELAARHGWEIRSFNPLSLDEVRAMAVALWEEFAEPVADLSNASDPAAKRQDPPWLTRLDAAWAPRATDLSAAGRVLILHGVAPPNALGPGSFHHQVLQRLGAEPAVSAGSPYITLDAEDVAALAPDVIVLLRPRAPGVGAGSTRAGVLPQEEIAGVLGALATLDIPAVRDGRVAVIDDPECLLPSTSLARFANDLSRTLTQW